MGADSGYAAEVCALKILVEVTSYARAVGALLRGELLDDHVAGELRGRNTNITLSHLVLRLVVVAVDLGDLYLDALLGLDATTGHGNLERTLAANTYRRAEGCVLLAASNTIDADDIVEVGDGIGRVVDERNGDLGIGVDATRDHTEILRHGAILGELTLYQHLDTHVLTAHGELLPSGVARLGIEAVDEQVLVINSLFYSRERKCLVIILVAYLRIGVTCGKLLVARDLDRLGEHDFVPT